ncbi:MAG: TRAP transporter small permease [Gammaproteobacteria bacterium]|nr:TRAP transporter small permease [Gammaproteobacteria bacterium]MCW9004267.1 TRAP transporter small permease [Gammaproteobacteria bacterium]
MKTFQTLALYLKKTLITTEKLLASASLITLLLLVIIQLIARNIFDYGFPLIDIISRHLILFILFMGAALISEQNKHIKIDILPTLISPNNKSSFTSLILILTACICIIFCWHSAAFWLDEFNYAPENELISTYLALALPFGFFILGLHFILLSITGFDESLISSDKQ